MLNYKIIGAPMDKKNSFKSSSQVTHDKIVEKNSAPFKPGNENDPIRREILAAFGSARKTTIEKSGTEEKQISTSVDHSTGISKGVWKKSETEAVAIVVIYGIYKDGALLRFEYRGHDPIRESDQPKLAKHVPSILKDTWNNISKLCTQES